MLVKGLLSSPGTSEHLLWSGVFHILGKHLTLWHTLWETWYPHCFIQPSQQLKKLYYWPHVTWELSTERLSYLPRVTQYWVIIFFSFFPPTYFFKWERVGYFKTNPSEDTISFHLFLNVSLTNKNFKENTTTVHIILNNFKNSPSMSTNAWSIIVFNNCKNHVDKPWFT